MEDKIQKIKDELGITEILDLDDMLLGEPLQEFLYKEDKKNGEEQNKRKIEGNVS